MKIILILLAGLSVALGEQVEVRRALPVNKPSKKEVALQNSLANVRIELKSIRALSAKLENQLALTKKANDELAKQVEFLGKQAKQGEAQLASMKKRADGAEKKVEDLKAALKSKFWSRFQVIMLVLPLGLVVGFIIGFAVRGPKVDRVYLQPEPKVEPSDEPQASPTGDTTATVSAMGTVPTVASYSIPSAPLVQVDEEFHGKVNGFDAESEAVAKMQPKPKKPKLPKAKKAPEYGFKYVGGKLMKTPTAKAKK